MGLTKSRVSQIERGEISTVDAIARHVQAIFEGIEGLYNRRGRHSAGSAARPPRIRGLEVEMYVAGLRVSGVRGFAGARSADLRLTRPDGAHAGWTVLAGRNGAGKTTLLRTIALALAGPFNARALMPSFDGWVTAGAAEGQVKAEIIFDSDWDSFTGKGNRPKHAFRVDLTWLNEPSPGEPSRSVGLKSTGSTAERGPWTDRPRGWFCAGYGPFRRLIGGSADAQRLMLAYGPVSRLASLFNEDASLAESVSWLVDLHLRQLEQRPGAAELLSFVLSLLNDGLLPDGFRVLRVDSDGLWASRDDDVIPLREMSDGYRTVTALVLDLVRQLHQVHGSEAASVEALANTPGVVLIDEIDVHLHVSWQKKIGEWLKSHFPRIQFIVSSHSPYICQSADPGGLIRLPGLGEDVPPRVVDEDLYERVVYGSGDDALPGFRRQCSALQGGGEADPPAERDRESPVAPGRSGARRGLPGQPCLN